MAEERESEEKGRNEPTGGYVVAPDTNGAVVAADEQQGVVVAVEELERGDARRLGLLVVQVADAHAPLPVPDPGVQWTRRRHLLAAHGFTPLITVSVALAHRHLNRWLVLFWTLGTQKMHHPHAVLMGPESNTHVHPSLSATASQGSYGWKRITDGVDVLRLQKSCSSMRAAAAGLRHSCAACQVPSVKLIVWR